MIFISISGSMDMLILEEKPKLSWEKNIKGLSKDPG